jgi:hypothetical protein
MHSYWTQLLHPLLVCVRPRVIVEIGIEDGKTSERLLTLCTEHDATLHGIDPRPLIDQATWQERWGARWNLHKGKSLDVLPSLPAFDAVLIDGDHNWYTVFHELQLIDRQAKRHRRTPIVLLHDIDAPYGRRDLYYDPESIPADARHPWQRRGIDVRQGTLTEQDGLNPYCCHATHEGGPRNGVRTAVEDFLHAHGDRYHFMTVAGFHGLGILVPTERMAADTSLQQFLDDLATSDRITDHMEQLESERIRLLPLPSLLANTRNDCMDLQRQCDELRQTIRMLEATCCTTMQEKERLHYAWMRAMHSLHRMQHTRSWRWTAWMRRLTGWMGRQT